MEKKLPISCYIRTLNEENTIHKVISSVIDFCSEVIVVDSGSTDRTQEIAESLGAKIISQAWLGNGYQKKVGEINAKFNWLLDLDADEVVSKELQASIRLEFAELEPTKFDVFELKLVTITPTRKIWNNSCLAWRNKLYNKSVYQIPEDKAWDQFSVREKNRVKKLQGALYHYSFKNFEHLINKMNRVSSVRAVEKKLVPKHILIMRILFGFPLYFAKKYFLQKMFLNGLYGFITAIIIASNRWFTDIKMYENLKIKTFKENVS